ITISSTDVVTILRGSAFSGNMLNINGNVIFNSLFNITFNGNKSSVVTGYSAIFVASGSSLTLNSKVLVTNSQSTGAGAGIYANGELILNGAQISSNISSTSGGGIYSSGKLTINAGTLISQNSSINGGGVYIDESASSFVMNDGSVTNNSARYGGGIYFASRLSGLILAGSISNNNSTSSITPYYYGGGIFVALNSGLLTFGNSTTYATISSNKSYYGGGVYYHGHNDSNADYNILINNVRITLNEATYGGGICIGDSTISAGNHTVKMLGGEITTNRTLTYGGGIYIVRGEFIIEGGTIAGNKLISATTYNNIYITAQNSTNVGVVIIYGGIIGTQDDNGKIYIAKDLNIAGKTGKLCFGGIEGKYFILNDHIDLVANVYLSIISEINENSSVIIIEPRSFPQNDYDKFLVATFASDVIPSDDIISVTDDQKVNCRFKLYGQDVYMTKAIFTLTINPGVGILSDNGLTGFNYTVEDSVWFVEVNYFTNLNDIFSKINYRANNRDFISWNGVLIGLEEIIDISTQKMPYSDFTLTAVWTEVYYTLTIDLNHTKGSTAQQVNFSTESPLYPYYNSLANTLTLKVFINGQLTTTGEDALQDVIGSLENPYLTRNGYIFSSFNTSQLGGDDDYSFGGSFSMPSRDLILYVLWQPKEFTIIYHTNAPASATAQVNPVNDQELTCEYDSFIIISYDDVFSLTGWTLSSWNTLANGTGTTFVFGTKYSFAYNANSTLDLYAIWTPITYTISYDSNFQFGEVTNTFSDNTVYSYDEERLLPSGSFTAVGYTQTGWRDELNNVYEIAGNVKNLTTQSNATLYAIWTANIIKVRIHEDGVNNASVYEKDYYYNDASDSNLPLVADISNLAKDFKVFGGWSISKYSNWNSATATFEDGDSILKYLSSGNLDLYPIWIPFTVNIHSNTASDEVVSYEVNSSGEVTILKASLSSIFTYFGFEIDHLSNTANIFESTVDFEFVIGITQVAMSMSGDDTLDLFVAWKAKTYSLQFVAEDNVFIDLTIVSSPQGNNAFAEENALQSVTLYGANDLSGTFEGWSFDINLTTFDAQLSQEFILTNDILNKVNHYQTLENNIIVFYALTSSTYTVTYDLNANGHNVITASTTSILPNGTNTTSTTSINNITNIVFADATGKVWEIADTQTDDINSVYAYFLGWSEDSSATEPTYFAGGKSTCRFATDVTLYAVWKQYTNPFFFTYIGSSLTGLSTIGRDNLRNDSEIILPHHSLVLTNGVVTVGDTITSVSFAENVSLNKIISLDFSLSKMVTSLPNLAFEKLTNLQSILNLPSSVNIGYGAFACENLIEITFDSFQNNYVFDKKGNLYLVSGNIAKLHTAFVIDSTDESYFTLKSEFSTNGINYSVTELLPYAIFKTFYIFITIPNSVTKIGQFAFKQTQNVINLSVPFVGESENTNTQLSYVFGDAQSVPASLKQVTITNQTDVKAGAFQNCSNISTVIYTKNIITVVNDDAFNGCSSYLITNRSGEIDFESLTTIGINAFKDCTLISGQIILSSVNEIGDNAFSSTSIQTVEINRNANLLSNTSFENVTTLVQAKVYKLNAFVSVISGTGIYKKSDANFSGDQKIYIDSILFSILNRTENAEYLEYNIIVEDMVELYNSQKVFKSSFSTLEEGISNASRNDIIIIKFDITLDSSILISKNITIFGAYQMISSSEEGASEYNNREITLTWSHLLLTNVFSINSDDVTFGYSGEFKTGYKVVPLNLIGNNNVNSSSLFSVYQGTLTLSGNLTISNNTARVGAVAYISDGEVIVDGAKIYNNKAIEQSGSTITGNGGVFYLHTKSYLTIKSGEIYSNSATRGGVAYSTLHSVITIKEQSNDDSLDIYNNIALEGGVLYIASNILDESASNIIGKSSIYSNKPASYTNSFGGAVCITSGMLKIEDDAHIYDCSSGNGGAIAVKKGILIVGKSLIGGESASGQANQAYKYDTSSGGKGGAIYIGDQGILRVITGAVISHNQAQYGGNIYFASTLTDNSSASKISGGTISYGNSLVSLSNSINYLGGAIYCASGVLSISNATIKRNLAGYGGAIYTINTKLNISNNALIDTNDAGKDGGGLFIAKSSSSKLITLDGAIFKNNLSQGNGGAIAVTGDEVDILATSSATSIGLKNDTLYASERYKGGNKANLNGGGLFIAGSGKVNVLSASIISNNTATNGGGIYYYNGSLILKSAIVRDNEASSNGGGIYVSDGNGDAYKITTIVETFEIYNSTTFTLNSAENGAGMFLGDREIMISSAIFSSNTAKDSAGNGQKGKGGAIFISSGAILTLDEVSVTGNRSTNNSNSVAFSGIYLNSTAQNALKMTNSTSLNISKNVITGADSSNPVYLIEGAIIIILDMFTENYPIKIYMEHELQPNEQILVARFESEEYASSAKFIANEIVFM
ncbi:MAG: hypothetical protein EOM05_08340, partial [Clostridia bacterium]|nr:hypothetical protein [Clostridia bacterium]